MILAIILFSMTQLFMGFSMIAFKGPILALLVVACIAIIALVILRLLIPVIIAGIIIVLLLILILGGIPFPPHMLHY
jgi:hypothetical protein